ncbi:sugar transferase [Streptomyces chrestomyceticus JCM 4735]|uniref:Sugar transferase n=1 Tax=Streptomyces chrestomyceticus JCM 4735 TaxID=1306181 RepID=A0A7U9PZD2_9ACTN|nr:GtrA family protein [Streptomyces chrestomyceticus]GCD37298.1 sugar transferase [Streptomyces chrestomyceticus JCM 4735]
MRCRPNRRPYRHPYRRPSRGRSPLGRLPLGRLLRFAVVGGVNTLTFYGCYLALHPWMPYFAAYTLAFLFSMVGSFFLNTYFTYRTRPSWKKFLLFPLTQVTNYVVQSVGLVVLVNWCGLGTRVAPLLAAVLAIPFTYLVSTRILVPGARASGKGGPVGKAGAAVPADEADRRTGDEAQPARFAGPL